MAGTKQRCCFEIDAHQIALRFSGHQASRRQERQRLLNLLEIACGKMPCMQMLQHAGIGILQCSGYSWTKKIGGDQAANQSGFVVSVLYDVPPRRGVKQTGV